ncbi:MAG TPA: type IV toxin-antitoxin system AbiEi family antitoxin domain-containing protein [Actinocrinis sp.]|nr:type IV toxin-antitoxin system AbiEi family antitoxin domain-containing protein [Actinocrinis sp.]
MKRAEALAILGGLASDQYGLITAALAKTRGVDGVTLLRLCDADLLENVGRGIYLLPGAVRPSHLEIRVAWLRLDPVRPAWARNGRGKKDGVVSHSSACLLHELGDIPTPKVELTVPGRLTTREPGVELHQHPGPLSPDEVMVVDGLPVTSAERTIVDLLQSGADAGHVGGVVVDAEHRGLVDFDALAARVERFADHYAVPEGSGRELLSTLAAAAGQQLNRDAVAEVWKEWVTVGAAAGYEDAVRQILQMKPANASWTKTVNPASLLVPAEVVKSLRSPVVSDFLAKFQDATKYAAAQQELTEALSTMKTVSEAVATFQLIANEFSNPMVRTALAVAGAQIMADHDDETPEDEA